MEVAFCITVDKVERQTINQTGVYWSKPAVRKLWVGRNASVVLEKILDGSQKIQDFQVLKTLLSPEIWKT